MNLTQKLNRVWHAGARKTTEIIFSRARRKLQGTRWLRKRFERSVRVDNEDDSALRDLSCGRGDDLTAISLGSAKTRHFIDDTEANITFIRDRFPQHVEQTCKEADRILRHEFRFLGREVTFGQDVDWHWRPEANDSWPVLHYADYGHSFWASADRPGDAKYPWELNRHQHLFTLAKAYRFTRDETYVEEIINQLDDWRARNPVCFGINWTSEMEVAIRIISWISTLWLLRDAPLLSERGVRTIVAGLYEHAKFLARNLTTDWFVRSNHIIGEAAGLYVFALMFPQFPESARWQARGLRILSGEIEAQVAPDGVNREQSTSYHRFVLDFLFTAALLAKENGVAFPDFLWRRIEAMVAYEAVLIDPDGIAPLIGDSDDGRGIMLSQAVAPMDFRGWVALGATLFERSDLALAVHEPNEEVLWLLGPDGNERLHALRADTAPLSSVHYDAGGQAVLRAGSRASETSVVFRCGDFGWGGNGACSHSHADLLAPIIRWRGKPFAIDPGTYTYYGDTKWRDADRSAHRHNTAVPAHLDQANMYPIWDWDKVPQAMVEKWEVTEETSECLARIVAPVGYRHRRRFLLDADGTRLIIEDNLELDRAEDGPVLIRFHLAPGVRAQREDTGYRIVCSTSGDGDVRITLEGFADCKTEEGLWYPSYGVTEGITVLCLTVAGNRAASRVVVSDVPSTE